MARLFKKAGERSGSLWRKAVDLALTDVRVAFGKGKEEESLEALEELLLGADFGVPATLRLIDHVERLQRRGEVRGREELVGALADEVREILEPGAGAGWRFAESGPTVHLAVGVNGTGKTTSIAKLAKRLQDSGRSVLLAAADTYRAGAVAQLSLWARELGCPVVGGSEGGDPAAVAFDAIAAARARGIDVVIVDTAGRLHTDRNLMEELRKVERVIGREVAGAPHDTFIVLDANIGQNSLSQLRVFAETVELSGIVLAKMDSSARGGVVVALREEFDLPVKSVGTGESLDDLVPFEIEDFVAGVFG